MTQENQVESPFMVRNPELKDIAAQLMYAFETAHGHLEGLNVDVQNFRADEQGHAPAGFQYILKNRRLTKRDNKLGDGFVSREELQAAIHTLALELCMATGTDKPEAGALKNFNTIIGMERAAAITRAIGGVAIPETPLLKPGSVEKDPVMQAYDTDVFKKHGRGTEAAVAFLNVVGSKINETAKRQKVPTLSYGPAAKPA